MAVFRYYWKDLREFARSNDSTFFSTPRGDYYNKLISEGVAGNFRLESARPLVVSHGSNLFRITRNYIEIEIPDEVISGVDTAQAPLYVFVGYRLAIFASTFGLTPDMIKTFKRVKRTVWRGGELVPLDRKIRDTTTFSSLPSYEIVEYPYLSVFVRYIYFRPRTFTISTATSTLASTYDISEADASEHLNRAFALGYLKIEEVEVYPKKDFPLLVVKAVSENEGVFSFSSLRRELTKYGISFRETFDLIFEALDKGWVDEVKGKYVTTVAGRAELPKLEKPKIRKLIVASAEGRRFIGM